MDDPANTITDLAMDVDGNGDQTDKDSGYGGSDRSSDSSRNSTSSMHTARSSMSADSGNASDRRSSVNSNSSDATFQSLSSQWSLGSSGYAENPNSSRRSSLLSDCSDSSTSTMRSDHSTSTVKTKCSTSTMRSDHSASTVRSRRGTPSTPKPRDTIQVFVEMSNKTYTIHIRPTEKIRQFKKKIQEKSGISPSQLKLKCKGKMLMNENATLQDYGIQDCSSVEQFAALCGGSY